MNSHYKLGHLLCRSRQPDFLLDILQRQGTNQAMPWLADLVESSEGSFSVLPVQCLCEFLLNDAFSQSEDEGGKGKKRKAGELLVHLGKACSGVFVQDFLTLLLVLDHDRVA